MTSHYSGMELLPIAGNWVVGGSSKALENNDPYTGEQLSRMHLATTIDVDRAFAAAAEQQPKWAALPAQDRAEVFHRAARIMESRKDEIVGWLTREAGAIRARAEWEWMAVRAVMLEAASYPSRVSGRILPADLIPGKENRVYRRPLGTVAVISPWNFPMQLSNRSVAPALAVGNAVVLKPSGDTPVTGGLLLAKIYEEAGLPPGLLSVVVGKSSEIGDHLAAHPSARLTSFTGSTEVGRHLAQQAPLQKMSLELGGNGPLVVLDDAPIERAVAAAVFGSYFHQGQVCMATNRIIVDERVHDEFVDRLRERASGLTFGDPSDPDTDIGPVINQKQFDSVVDKIDSAQKQGADVFAAGSPCGPSGLVLAPHVILGDNRTATAREEVFGPVATVIKAADEDHALAIANDTEYGLSSGVITADTERGVQFALRMEAGMTHVNDTTVNDEPNTAFGGEKNSGIGRFGGDWAISEFTTDHWISVQHSDRTYAI
ncbi:4-hydroxybenzaldehyde dehydrogenase [Williamsia limnetica]|uniref:4-hydroxybenzaldehyde dehydrogenase n=1 Tax=Williamsia limnetica TaxID=882452 RepID=A0A318RL39_WILLI|nr:aldehyde dehydrogenase family protein [Williamsia limnetica]PYE18758.1 4-hydroxybenzaldehyde dehydrogenase [Williamsia limnetica]